MEGLAVSVEGELHLWEEKIPPVCRERGCGASKDGKEMVLEGVDGPFCSILLVDMGGNKLEGAIVGLDGL